MVTLLALSATTAMSAQVMTDNDILNADLQRLMQQGSRRSVAQYAPNSGLVAHYEFDNNCNDLSGNNNNGQLKGAATYANGMLGGQQNTCLSLGGPGNPGCVRVANSSSMALTGQWTIATFVKMRSERHMDGWGRTTHGGSGTIIAKDHDRSGFCILASLKDGKFSVWMGGPSAGGGASASLEGVYANQWVHVAYTYNNGEYRVYLNGKLKTTKSARPDFRQANGRDLYLGKFSDTWYPLDGYLDDVRLYNRCLSAEEIAALAEM